VIKDPKYFHITPILTPEISALAQD